MLTTARASPAMLCLLNLISPFSPAHPCRLMPSRPTSQRSRPRSWRADGRRLRVSTGGRGGRGMVAMRADAGYFAGALARAAHDEHISFAIGAKRIAPLWRLLAGLAEDDWHDAIDMDGAQVAVAQYCPDWWPEGTRLLIRRVLLDPEQVSAALPAAPHAY